MSGQRRFVVDTSVALPLLVATHSHHAEVAAWADGQSISLSGHAFVETYAVLTRLPGGLRVTGEEAELLLTENFADPVQPSAASVTGFARRCAQAGIVGSATYDALVAVAAADNDCVLVTRDARARSTYLAIGATVKVLIDRP